MNIHALAKGTPTKLIKKINAMSHARATRINQAHHGFDLPKQLDKLFVHPRQSNELPRGL